MPCVGKRQRGSGGNKQPFVLWYYSIASAFVTAGISSSKYFFVQNRLLPSGKNISEFFTAFEKNAFLLVAIEYSLERQAI